MDRDTKRIIDQLQFPSMTTIALEDFEANDEDLLAAKSNRSKVEYFFTCTPSLPLYILHHWPEVDLITYLDADLYFFDSPDPIFQEMKGNSVGIIEHRFPDDLRDPKMYGIYNVGWLSFRRDINGMTCLNWWRERCNEWCYARYEEGRFADQKYLDGWPSQFSGVRVIQHKGANVAPWNLARHRPSLNGNVCMIGTEPLVFFHFHGLKQVLWRFYNPNFDLYNLKINQEKISRKNIVQPYLESLAETQRLLLNSGVTLDGSSSQTKLNSIEIARNFIAGLIRGRLVFRF